MDLSGIKGKINGILEKVKGISKYAGGIFKKTKRPKTKRPKTRRPKSRTAFSKTKAFKKPRFLSDLLDLLNSLLDRVGPNKKKPLLIGFGALAGFFLVLAIVAGILSSKKKQVVSPKIVAEGAGIPADELFIPAEPDFLPEFVFEREKRSFWSLEDIRPYWKAPDKNDRWIEEIKSAVDKLMEGIP